MERSSRQRIQLCKDPEVGKSPENAGDSKRTGVAAETEGKHTSEGAGKVGRSQVLQGLVGLGQDSVFILWAV